jgi:N-acetylmuramoyl-L-alanine amidase
MRARPSHPPRLRAVAIIAACVALTGTAATEPAVIVIDPGHPSETSAGDAVQNGVTEVEVAWEVALRLEKMLQERGHRVVLTKGAVREMVTNRVRAEIANGVNAAVLIRLHADTGPHRGFALYYPDRQGTADGFTGPDSSVIRRSQAAAVALHAGMAETLRGVLEDGGVLGDSKTEVGSKQGALTGSIFSTVPAVTIEMVVLADSADAAFIRSEAGKVRMATAIAAGVDRLVPPSAGR